MAFTPSENPITNPTRESYTELRPFRFWCQKVLPLVYDDSLSYYELLCKVVDYLNKTMEDVDHMNTDVDTLYDSFQEFQEGTFRIYNELVTYVNTYFDELDVQEEINNKLDDMVTSGELVTVLSPTIANEVSRWLSENITPTTPIIDDTLTIRGAGADAKVVGDFKKLSILNSYKVTSSSDLNDLNNAPDNSIGYFQIPLATPTENIPLNYPENSVIQGMGFLLTLSMVNYTKAKLQYYFSRTGVFWCREYNGSWQNWKKSVDDTLTLNVSANAKTVGDALIKKLGISTSIIYSRNSLSDFNNAENNTVYTVNIARSIAPENIPLNYPEENVIVGVGILCTFNSNLIREQVYYSIRTCKTWSRYYANNTWSAWYKEAEENTSVSYAEISDNEYSENLFTGTFSSNGSAVISGNTATITQAYQGMLSNEFIPETDTIRVKTTITTDLERVMLRLQYFNNNNWSTSPSLYELTSGVESNNSISLENYEGTKYRVLIQSENVPSGSTKTLTVSNLEIYNESPLAHYKYYDKDFIPMMEKIFNGIDAEKNTFYVKKDGSGDFASFVDCINYINDNNIFNAIVYVGEGIYNLLDELGSSYVDSASSTNMGLVLKNRVHVICSSKTVLQMKYTGSRDNVKEYLSAINSGIYGFTLENARIETENVRYSIHDDLGYSGNIPYSNKYINCTLIHKNGFYSDCIGGGLGENGNIEIRGCYLEGDGLRERLAYYHGNNNPQVNNAKCRIVVADNYFALNGTFKLTKYGQSETVSTAYVSNNSFGSEPEITTGSVAPYDNMQMIEWNNEIRNV